MTQENEEPGVSITDTPEKPEESDDIQLPKNWDEAKEKAVHGFDKLVNSSSEEIKNDLAKKAKGIVRWWNRVTGED